MLMLKTKCPHCGVKLGDFLYADACPHCHEVLEHNLADQSPPRHEATGVRCWPLRALSRVVRFVES